MDDQQEQPGEQAEAEVPEVTCSGGLVLPPVGATG